MSRFDVCLLTALLLLSADAVAAQAHPRPGAVVREPASLRGIPAPPSMARRPLARQPTREQWYRSLTRAQRRSVDRFCAHEENAFEPLCGGTPLVAVFDGRPVEFGRVARFPLRPGDEVSCAFPTPRTPWIARDLDGDGVIGSAAELFGSSTALADGELARDGFEALAALDSNGDDVLDARDPAFGALLLWSDLDDDRRGADEELTRLADRIESISLLPHDVPRCDGRGNCEKERATMVWRDTARLRLGAVVDVHLRFFPVEDDLLGSLSLQR